MVNATSPYIDFFGCRTKQLVSCQFNLARATKLTINRVVNLECLIRINMYVLKVSIQASIKVLIAAIATVTTNTISIAIKEKNLIGRIAIYRLFKIVILSFTITASESFISLVHIHVFNIFLWSIRTILR